MHTPCSYSVGPSHVISAPVLVSNGGDSPPPLLKCNGSLSDVTTPTQEKETSPPPLSHSVAANANCKYVYMYMSPLMV